MKYFYLFALTLSSFFCLQIRSITAWGSNADRVKLEDVKVLTLKDGQWTSGRRSQGIKQLACVGGTASHNYRLLPKVVQCYNKGSDGYDIQWECKADLDTSIVLRDIVVICEGYDSPDDPYVLKGSCGLEYTLDYSDSGGGGSTYGWNTGESKKKHSYESSWSDSITNIACIVIICIIAYAIYVTCIAPTHTNRQYSRTNDDFPPGQGPGARPSPPGFHPSFFGNTDNNYSGDSCSSGARASAGSFGGGGFWTGAATGGMLGYLFGQRRNNAGYSNTMYGQPSASYGFGNSGSAWGGSSRGFSSASTGSRTASGFGGTRRR